ncbi:MAG: hypothetical protein KBT04_00650 [Bacteroidales bacterium]|nr:hypothetical protein [Candidatus Colimorpha onthohippi]
MIYKESDWHILLDGKKILIAGYGREGRSSQTFLSKLLPTANIDVADGNSNIQSAAPHYDLILKSPGIPMSVFADVCPLHKVSSQSDLFLQVYHNQTIGITGTKGKSTTTELINHMLVNGLPLSPRQSDQQFTNVIKAGNMGIPLFDIIPQMSESTLVVAELSCHQLENIHCAPHISVLLNLFQEHLDHYPSYRRYKMAKLNIALKQYKNDHCFYCADNPDLTDLISELRKQITSQISPYTATLEPTTIPYSPSLQGLHNRSNAIVAKMVAQ